MQNEERIFIKAFTGKNLCKYENGQKKLEGNYKDGKKEGKQSIASFDVDNRQRLVVFHIAIYFSHFTGHPIF